MGAIRWLVSILSFFIPPLGFITFWVFAGKQEEELKRIARWSLVASFIGAIIWIILVAVDVSLGILGIGLAWLLG